MRCLLPTCQKALPADATTRRRYCNDRHRAAHKRFLASERAAALSGLLQRQTDALQRGDAAALAAAQRDAARLLGRS